MIPRVIHQIWLSDSLPLPEKYREYVNQWESKNPWTKHVLWGEEIFEEFGGKDHFYKKYNILHDCHPAQLTDTLRLLLIHKFGGVYADIDTECISSIDDLLYANLFIYNYGLVNDKPLICTDFFGASPGNEIIRNIIEDIEQGVHRRKIRLWKHGFRVTQKHFLEHVHTDTSKDVYHYSKEEIEKYVIHHFFNSWVVGTDSYDFTETDS